MFDSPLTLSLSRRYGPGKGEIDVIKKPSKVGEMKTHSE